MKLKGDNTNTDYNAAEIAGMKKEDFIAQHKGDFFKNITDETARTAKLGELHQACCDEVKAKATAQPAAPAQTVAPAPDPKPAKGNDPVKNN